MAPIPFSGNPLIRLEHLRLDSAALSDAQQAATSRFLVYSDLRPLMCGAALQWLAPSELPRPGGCCVFLGLDGDRACFAVDCGDLPDPAANGRLPGAAADSRFEDARAAAALLSAGDSAIMGQGRSLLAWHARHGFCAACGSPTEVIRGGAARRCSDAACAAEHYPRVDPVVIMLVTRGDFCLMGRQPRFPPGMYSALAGFMEPGETIEEAVRREVQEEAAVQVSSVTYALSQPWPFPSNLMIGCFATAEDDRITPDENEIEDLQWFSRAEVAAALTGNGSELIIPGSYAIAHSLLKLWVTGRA